MIYKRLILLGVAVLLATCNNKKTEEKRILPDDVSDVRSIKKDTSVFVEKDTVIPEKTDVSLQDSKKATADTVNTKDLRDVDPNDLIAGCCDEGAATITYLEGHIGLAYSREVYEKYINTNRAYLFSLINKFDQRYKNYINKAYSEKEYDRNSYNYRYLDSLIKVYEENKTKPQQVNRDSLDKAQ